MISLDALPSATVVAPVYMLYVASYARLPVNRSAFTGLSVIDLRTVPPSAFTISSGIWSFTRHEGVLNSNATGAMMLVAVLLATKS